METAKAEKLLLQMTETQQALSELLETPLEIQLRTLEPIDKARLLVTLSYTINSLAFVFLKLQGIQPKTHPVKKELDRIKTYFEKIETVSGGNRNTMQIDQAAAKRFLHHSLAANPELKDEIAKTRKSDSVAAQVSSVEQDKPGTTKDTIGIATLGKASKKLPKNSNKNPANTKKSQ
ncbi:hypothetical protein BASA50_003585 [Batrachochytrium salamandrivorans]|uniref:Exosome complex protein n=1 Tax=Batrachochytrium salamandrivorans TaxID=1357716 RepID=A0ABQ8FHV1_9FUNG|nr:hypothetical protein BASA62_009913 [Batrachochytrium salamandrivorans]KAH6569842.1 hypothetical protein BASA60_008038 [Batrachochytrium salamandrivorans]KAH6598546.1 hypothetical protein BASA50_003585 [Batrachochytrium salamandrivorans]KAH6602087.1 hypothetical protein BASA61_001456 [Batrachochytrium salamandrivorans]KAH9266587.1 hypothetical protein BASA84_001075 [Batrachochytrium salamandrivorans]